MLESKMTALLLESYEVQTFRKTEIQRPVIGPGQVLVRIKASGVNPIDTKIRTAVAPYAMPELPAILGTDMAGIVISTGEGVTAFKSGDEVYGLTGGVRGLQGSLAQFAAVDEKLIAIKPTNLTMREAAALPLVFLTAWEGLVDHADVREGDRVLVNGGAGGVGHMVIQLARAFGANVYATASGEKCDLVRQLGATPINYREQTVEQYVEEHTDGKGFDIIYDTVGGDALSSVLGAVRHYGHITSCGAFGEYDITTSSLRSATLSAVFVLLRMLSGEKRAHHGEVLTMLTRFIEDGKIKPVVDARHFTLDTALEAHKTVEDTSAAIKIVIDVD
ncbi:zinc-dependent alcohol dehydrogenase family protein [Proteus myxofaciens]|uniref:Zinc-containing alcohol dehydrogenase/quinone oxidoreductase n=1 Tax=Proteus myxofaciens ATCC 19692 TaxID=1354337 RepID=A0A198FCF8_9GAMM|nr:zinc-dependent alcohol dehydrogenase family protein [Proteus myxofaciens]OAT22583.1 zinc-containing alcohol dehydrogenase/quinone oxidoreductase [Proteus myxofaciens ATCC 19692]